MLQIKDVPFRRWHKGRLVETKEGKRIMSLMFKEMARGKAVEMVQSLPVFGAMQVGTHGAVHDTISLTVTD